jgi:hypothetical protein
VFVRSISLLRMRPSPHVVNGGKTFLRSVVGAQTRQSGGAWSSLTVRSFASDNGRSERKRSDSGSEESKQQAPKAGPGFFETLRKRFTEQWNQQAQQDPKLQEAMKTMDQVKEDAEAAARRAMEVSFIGLNYTKSMAQAFFLPKSD